MRDAYLFIIQGFHLPDSFFHLLAKEVWKYAGESADIEAVRSAHLKFLE